MPRLFPKVPAGGRTALQGVAARTAVPEHPTSVYVGCGAYSKRLSLILLRVSPEISFFKEKV